MNFPNKITMLRIVMIPLFIGCFYLPVAENTYIAGAVFVLAYFTDVLDGVYARKHKLVTDFGKLMDPVADKMLTVSALVMVVAQDRLSPVIAIVIIARELFVSGFRIVGASKGKVMAAGTLGKIKTVSQFVAISLILFDNPIFRLIHVPMDQIAIYASAALTVWSGVDYVVKNQDIIKDR